MVRRTDKPGTFCDDMVTMNSGMPTPVNVDSLKVGAVNNGLTVDEIKATLLHATAYCGIPAGLDAFKAAHEVLIAEGAIPGKK